MAVSAAEPNEQVRSLVDSYKKSSGAQSFSAEEGRKFFNSKRTHSVKKEERSCTTCHTTDPRQPGKTIVGKVIEPLAPSVNKERFTDPEKIEKWFKRNCTWVLERECTPREKGDYITYMMSL
ncbi:MAG: DUF1924 domain-containing protein [Deltaproteobacteria bacterium]|nr:DUF1924 domain-containing protein [Deltaproteobacteria bacterium]